MPTSLTKVGSTEIAAGSIQLQPLDAASRPGAVAALGAHARDGSPVWVARDALSGLPRAYVAAVINDGQFTLYSSAGLHGDDNDAQDSRAVVDRFLREAHDLHSTSEQQVEHQALT